MNAPINLLRAVACGWLLATGALTLVMAQPAAVPDTPSAEQMIEQLRPPRTRSLRNLVVEAAPPPSLTLLIQFDFDSARVRPESEEALANLARALQSGELIASRFAIEGHTDGAGRPEYNQRLSQRRADAVRDLLARSGVAAARLVSAGKGASDLANPADPRAPENRRVRIVNLN